MTVGRTRLDIRLSSDAVLGAVGGTLAVFSAAFGIYMAVKAPQHTPSQTGDFSVFAQLTPRPDSVRAHPSSTKDDLDMATTASVKGNDEPRGGSVPADMVVVGIVLRSAANDSAEIAVDGRSRAVRVGDTIPGAGDVVAIYAGRRPMLKTTRGFILPEQR